MGSIRLSEKHGVNPSLMMCPLCGKDTGVALLGRLKDDAEAPRKLADPDPCETCRGHMAKGIVLVEARQADDCMTLLGGYWVITEDAARRIFTGKAGAQTLKRRAAYIEPEVVERLGLRKVTPTESGS